MLSEPDLTTTHLHAILSYLQRVVIANQVLCGCQNAAKIRIGYNPVSAFYVLRCTNCQMAMDVPLHAVADWWQAMAMGTSYTSPQDTYLRRCVTCEGKSDQPQCPTCQGVERMLGPIVAISHNTLRGDDHD